MILNNLHLIFRSISLVFVMFLSNIAYSEEIFLVCRADAENGKPKISGYVNYVNVNLDSNKVIFNATTADKADIASFAIQAFFPCKGQAGQAYCMRNILNIDRHTGTYNYTDWLGDSHSGKCVKSDDKSKIF
mgnify:CR=1 FL=1